MKHSDGQGSSGSSGHRPVQSVTSAPPSAADDQGTRMRRYLIAMGLRGLCFVLAIVASGWLRWAFVAGAVVLPYIAVVLANAVGPRFGQAVAPVGAVADERPALRGVIADDGRDADRLPGDRRESPASSPHDG